MHLLKHLALLIPAIRNLYTQRNQLLADKQQLTAESQALRSQITELTSESLLLRKQVETLTTDINTLRSDKQRLTAESETRQAHIAQLAADRDSLNARLEAMTAEATSIRHDRQELSGAVESLQAQINHLVADRQSLVDRLGALTQELGDVRLQMAGLEMRLSDPAIPEYAKYYRRNIQALESRRNATRAYVIIGSAGRTATHWLTVAFNLHEKVFFSHGPDLEPQKHVAADMREYVDKRIHQQMKSFDFSDIDKYFDLLEARGDYIVYGNIHGVQPTNVCNSPDSYRRRYYSCALFRHPVTRVQSLVSKWTSYLRNTKDPRGAVFEIDKFKTSDEVAALAKRYGIGAFDKNGILFIKAVHAVFLYDKDHLASGMPLFQMEWLVSDIEYFLSLFCDATAGLVEPTDSYVKALRRLKPIDQLGEKAVTAGTLFSSWDSWKQKYFLDELQRLELLDRYNLLGYNLRAIMRGPFPRV